MDAYVGVAQIVAEVLGEGFDGRFGRVVSRVAWWVRDALLAACDDDGGGGAGGAGLEGGDVGV